MGKLYFYYGCMDSMKSANAIMQAYSHRNKGKKVAILKHELSDGNGDGKIHSRCGLESEAIVIKTNTEPENVLGLEEVKNADVVIADECQFFEIPQILAFRYLALDKLVFCYGLKTNFKFEVWMPSLFLMSIADSVREIPSMCSRCTSKSVVNARIKDGEAINEGDIIEHDVRHGGNTKYESMCFKCWITSIAKSGQAKVINKCKGKI
jgi:thymidine kinase